jgi:hypothetical protein
MPAKNGSQPRETLSAPSRGGTLWHTRGATMAGVDPLITG